MPVPPGMSYRGRQTVHLAAFKKSMSFIFVVFCEPSHKSISLKIYFAPA